MERPKDILKKYQSENNAYIERVGNQGAFEDQLRDSIQKKTGGNQDLLSREATASQQVQALPATLRSNFYESNIRNPLTQEAIIQQRRAVPISELETLRGSREARGMRYEDLLGTAMRKENAGLERQRMSAESLFNYYKTLQDQENFERQMSMQGGSGGNGDDKDISQLLASLGIGVRGAQSDPASATKLFEDQYRAMEKTRDPIERANMARIAQTVLPYTNYYINPALKSKGVSYQNKLARIGGGKNSTTNTKLRNY